MFQGLLTEFARAIYNIYIYVCVLHSLVMICGAYFHIREAPFFSLNICDILYMFLPKHLVWDLG